MFLFSVNTFAKTSNIQIYQYYKDSTNNYHMFGRVYKDSFTEKGLSAGLKALLKKKLKNIPLKIQIFDNILYTKTNNLGFFKVRFYKENLSRPSEKTIISIEPNQNNHQGVLTIFPSIYEKNKNIGIISDIDDTVLVTDCRSKTKMLVNTFFKSVEKREAVKGKSLLYRSIINSNNQIPLIFLSSSPIHLYQYLSAFLALHKFPAYIMKLKVLTFSSLFSKIEKTKKFQMLEDFSIENIVVKPDSLHGHLDYKVNKIISILEEFPNHNFILFGDSGESDPEIYFKVLQTVPDRIINTFIRDITGETERFSKIQAELAKINKQMIFSKNELIPARYCYSKGFISRERFLQIKTLFDEKISDRNTYIKINKILLNITSLNQQLENTRYPVQVKREYNALLDEFKNIISDYNISKDQLIDYNEKYFPEVSILINNRALIKELF